MGKSIRVSNGKETLEIGDTDLPAAAQDGYLPTERIIVANPKTKETYEIAPQDYPHALKDGFNFSDIAGFKGNVDFTNTVGLISKPQQTAQPQQQVGNIADVSQVFKPGFETDADMHQKALQAASERVGKTVQDLDPAIRSLLTETEHQRRAAQIQSTVQEKGETQLPGLQQRIQSVLPKPLPVEISPEQLQSFRDQAQHDPSILREALRKHGELNPSQQKSLEADMYLIDSQNRATPEKTGKILQNAENIKAGNLDYSIWHGGPVEKPQGFLDALITGHKERNKELDDYQYFQTHTDAENQAYLEKERQSYDPEEPVLKGKGGLGIAGQMLGSNLVPMIKGSGVSALSAVAGAPEAAPWLAAAMTTPEYTARGFVGSLKQNYNDLVNQGLSPTEAYQKAKTQATYDAAAAGAQGALQTFAGAKIGLKGGEGYQFSPKFKNIITGIAKGSKDFVAEGLKTGVPNAAIAGGLEASKNIVANASGQKRDITQNVFETAGGQLGFELGLGLIAKPLHLGAAAFKTVLHNISKQPDAEIKGGLGQLVTSGQIEPHEADNAMLKIEQQQSLDKQIPPHIEDEGTRIKIQDLIEHKTKLESDLETLNKAYHPAIKNKIADIDEQIQKLSDLPVKEKAEGAAPKPKPTQGEKKLVGMPEEISPTIELSTNTEPYNTRTAKKTILNHLLDNPGDVDGAFRKAGYVNKDGFWVEPGAEKMVDQLSAETKATLKKHGIKYVGNADLYPLGQQAGVGAMASTIQTPEGIVRGIALKNHGETFAGQDHFALHEAGHAVWIDLPQEIKDLFNDNNPISKHGQRVKSGEAKIYGKAGGDKGWQVGEEDFADQFALNKGDIDKTISDKKNQSTKTNNNETKETGQANAETQVLGNQGAATPEPAPILEHAKALIQKGIDDGKISDVYKDYVEHPDHFLGFINDQIKGGNEHHLRAEFGNELVDLAKQQPTINKTEDNAVQEQSNAQVGAHDGGPESIGGQSEGSGMGSNLKGNEPPGKGPEENESAGEKEGIGVGVSHGSLKTLADKLGLAQPERGEVLKPEEYVQRGRELLKGGANPDDVAEDYYKTGKVSADAISVVRAHFENLVKDVRDAYENYGVDSPEYKDAKQKADDWQADVVKPMGTSSGEAFRALQGETDIDTGSFYGMQSSFENERGHPMTPKDEVIAKGHVEKIAEQEKQLEALTKQLRELHDKNVEIEAPKTIKEKTQKIANAIRKGKASRPDTFSSATPGSLVWDGALEVAAKVMEASGTIVQAVADGIEHIKNSEWYKGLSEDKQKDAQKGFTDYIDSLDEAKRERASKKAARNDYRRLETERNRQLEVLSKLNERKDRLLKEGEKQQGNLKAPIKDTPEIEAAKKEITNIEKQISFGNSEVKRIESERAAKIAADNKRVETERNRQLLIVDKLKEKRDTLLKTGEKLKSVSKTPKQDTPEIQGIKSDIAKIEKQISFGESEVKRLDNERDARIKADNKRIADETNRQLSKVADLNNKLDKLKNGIREKKVKGAYKEDTPEVEALKDQIYAENEKLKKIERQQREIDHIDELSTRFANKTDNKFDPEDARDIWGYATREYLDKGASYPDMVNNVSKDLGLSPEQVRNAITQPKGAKIISDEIYNKNAKKNVAISEAKLWVKANNQPRLIKFFKGMPNFFFAAKVFGHGTVAPITHAGMNIFYPSGWKHYFPFMAKSWKFAFGGTTKNGLAYYNKAMADLKADPDFTFWKREGLAVDPKEKYDDYQGAGKIFGKIGAIGDRGFNALKPYRLAMAKMFYDHLSNVEKADPETAKNIAKVVNHMSGTSEIDFGKITPYVSTAYFAPKLEMSRWQGLITDPMKAAGTFMNWKKATPAEQVRAKIVARKAGEIMATYMVGLAANSAILSLSGSKQSINYLHPTDNDWLKFKVGGKTLDPTGGMEATMRFIGTILHTGYLAYEGNKKDLREKPQEKDYKVLGQQLRYKLSPFMSTLMDFATGTDAMGRPTPGSKVPPKKGETGYTMLWPPSQSYVLQQQLPIPISEGVKGTVESMKERGMDNAQIKDVLTGILIGAISGGTGAKVGNDYGLSKMTDEQKKTAAKMDKWKTELNITDKNVLPTDIQYDHSTPKPTEDQTAELNDMIKASRQKLFEAAQKDLDFEKMNDTEKKTALETVMKEGEETGKEAFKTKYPQFTPKRPVMTDAEREKQQEQSEKERDIQRKIANKARELSKP